MWGESIHPEAGVIFQSREARHEKSICVIRVICGYS